MRSRFALVVGEPKAGANVIAWHAAQRKKGQPFAGRDDGVGIALRGRQRRPLCNVEEQRLELVAGFRGEDNPVRLQPFVDTFLRAAASRALTAAVPTAREGSAFSAS